MSFTKQDKKDLKEILLEVFEPFAIAIQTDFNRFNDRFDKIETRLDDIEFRLRNIERRVIYIEDVITKHSKELKIIRKILAEYRKEEKLKERKVNVIDNRVKKLELEVFGV